MKPILFNTDMVRAILEGRKTVTRRVVKPQPREIYHGGTLWEDGGDLIAYVRETWHKDVGRYMYKADYSNSEKFYLNGKEISIKWSPSIHMPREAARIFLRVTDVRVERLRDITKESAWREGCNPVQFPRLWDSTIKPADRALYGWGANPWVFVISFERISKDEAMQ